MVSIEPASADGPQMQALTTLAGWRQFAAEMRAAPQLLNTGTWQALEPGKRAAYDDDRIAHHSRLLGRAALRQAETGRRYTRQDIQHAYAAKLERYAAIRRDFHGGMSERTIERRHHVGRRTIVMALDSPEPPARKRIHREPTALKGLHDHIDAMLEADACSGTAAIWQRLADDHGVTVAHYTLRTYVVSRRTAKPPDKND